MKNYNTLRCWLCWLVGALAISFVGLQASVDGAPATESSSELLDDLGGDLFGPSKSSQLSDPDQKLPQPAASAGEDLGQPGENSPLANIVGNMQQARRLIAQKVLTGQTAQVQENVLASLDELIKQSQQQNQNNSQSQQQQQQQQQQASQRSTPKPSQANQQAGQQSTGSANAARTSSERLEAGAADEAAGQGSRELLKDVWGQLPERVRQQLLQSSTDEFLPQYRDEIERYFKRLAEEEANSAGSADQ